MLKKIYRKFFGTDFQKVTAKKVATENGIEYISDAKGKKMNSNDGMPTCPFEWWGTFDGKPQMIMDNQSSFKGITNLSEIILKMVELYAKYIDQDLFIASLGFAIRLDDTVTPNYHGRATLVLTEDAIRNNKVKPDQILEAKKYFINDFLDHYIGWNFGVAVTSNPELEKALIQFNNLVIEKGLREDAGPGFEVWQSDDVMHYDLTTA